MLDSPFVRQTVKRKKEQTMSKSKKNAKTQQTVAATKATETPATRTTNYRPGFRSTGKSGRSNKGFCYAVFCERLAKGLPTTYDDCVAAAKRTGENLHVSERTVKGWMREFPQGKNPPKGSADRNGTFAENLTAAQLDAAGESRLHGEKVNPLVASKNGTKFVGNPACDVIEAKHAKTPTKKTA